VEERSELLAQLGGRWASAARKRVLENMLRLARARVATKRHAAEQLAAARMSRLAAAAAVTALAPERKASLRIRKKPKRDAECSDAASDDRGPAETKVTLAVDRDGDDHAARDEKRNASSLAISSSVVLPCVPLAARFEFYPCS